MPDPKQPPKPRSPEEILREMEAISTGAKSSISSPASKPAPPREEGTLKSLLGFFVKIVPDEEPVPPPKSAAPPPKPAAPLPAPTPVTEKPVPYAPPVRVPNPLPDPLPTLRPGPRVGDLVSSEPLPKFTSPPADANDLSSKPFEEIYREAGLSNSAYTVDELATLMDNPTIANQPMSVKVIAVNLALTAKGIGPDVPIADAVRRDRALDAYQEMLTERARTTEQRNMANIQQLQQEVEEFLKRKQAEIEALRSEISEYKRQSVDFAYRREGEEKRLASLISPFLEGRPNPVTIGNQPGEDKG